MGYGGNGKSRNPDFKVITDLPESLPVLESTLRGLEDLFAEFLAELEEGNANAETGRNLLESVHIETGKTGPVDT